MGRARKLKLIRKLASKLPVVQIERQVPFKISGAELLKEGMKEHEGKPIHPLDYFKGNDKVVGNINHEKEMKRLLNKSGHNGVIAYCENVEMLNNAQG